MLENIILLASIQFLGAMSPGPDFFLIFKNTLTYSQKQITANVFGIAFGCLIHTTTIVLGIDLIKTIFPQFVLVLKYLGALYLIYLGVISFLPEIKTLYHKYFLSQKLSTIKKLDVVLDVDEKNSFQTGVPGVDLGVENRKIIYCFFEGLLCNLLNPKVAIFFFSLFSQFIKADTSNIEKIAYLTVIFLSTLIWFFTLSQILNWKIIKGRLQKWQVMIGRLMALVLITLGVNIIFL